MESNESEYVCPRLSIPGRFWCMPGMPNKSIVLEFIAETALQQDSIAKQLKYLGLFAGWLAGGLIWK